MKKLKLYILLFLVVFLSNFVSAQNLDTLQIQILAGVFEDSIILRWSPSDVKSWTFGNDNGYILERTTIKRNGTPLSTEEVRTSKQRLGSFNIASQEEWEKLMAENEYAGVAAGAIFGEGFKVEGLEDENLMSFYYLTKEQENRYGFSLFAADQSLEVSDAMGLRFVDKNFNEEEEYLYKVRFNVSQDSIYTLDGATLVNPKEKMNLAQAPEIFASFNDLFAIISWDGTDLIKDYSTYHIERSDDNGLSFNILNENPLLPNTNQKTGAKTFLYTDSLAQNGKKYMYRIRGRSLFGVMGPYSNVVEGMGEKGPCL